jgi:L-rhamnose-H+ transport protein
MEPVTGLLLVVVGGFLQGTFVLPMTLTRKWQWEHTWAAFSLLGMWVLNWIITLILIPNVLSIYQAVSINSLVTLALFGCGWGVGAILFGLGMDKLGMALGYPIIMGLIASLGALIPLLRYTNNLLQPQGLFVLLGTAVVVYGIVLCSKAAAAKDSSAPASDVSKSSLRAGLIIAVLAGIFSCLPNVGMNFSGEVLAAARDLDVAPAMINNTVWALFFTMGGVVNVGYCACLVLARKNLKLYAQPESGRNLGLSVAMSAMWIGSFYVYGAAASRLGDWGGIIGWPVFIALSIVVGNLWGLWRGEWKGAPPHARKKLAVGLAVLLGAVAITTLSEFLAELAHG